MEYSQTRQIIQNGNLVFFKPQNIFAKLIAICTKGAVSHCGILVWIKDSREVPRLAVLEGHTGGCRLVTMSYYKGRASYVVDVGLDWCLIEDYAYEKTGKTAYAYFDFITIWLKELLLRAGFGKYSKLIPNTEGEVSSEVVADIMQKANFKIDVLLSPQKLFEYAKAATLSGVLEIDG